MTGAPRTARVLLAAVGVALVSYDLLLRPWMRDWGSTGEERDNRLPGDEVVTDVMSHYTKGLTINAPAEAVWPWLIQIGDRAGFYSYDWIERFVFPAPSTLVFRSSGAFAGPWGAGHAGDTWVVDLGG
jgi:hypothetical protein